jgi:hypothetical protein
MIRLTIFSCILAAAIALTGCSSATTPAPVATPPPTVNEVQSPAGAISAQPALSAAADGRVFMSWIEPAQPIGSKLLFSVRDSKGAWSEPRMIAEGEHWFVNDSDYPSMIALADGSLAAQWLANNEPGSEAYDVNIALSKDGGATWSKPIVPHRDKTKSEHGFASLIPANGGGLHIVWLDGRKTNKDGEGDMAMMHTTIAADGTLGPETQLDDRVCECCHTSAAATPSGLMVVYRDRSPKEIRDISIVRYSNGAWSPSEALSSEGWEIDGCPVNGPAVSSDGQNVAAAWFSAAKDKPRVDLALSSDGGKTFSKRVQIDDGNPAGHVGVRTLSSGGALVTWTEHTEKGAEVRIRRVDPEGKAQPSIKVSGSTGVRSIAVAQLERSGNQAVIAWTDAGKPARVKTAVLGF